MLAKTYGLSEEDGQRISKGVVPYTFFISFDALENATELPPITAFFNDLTEQECSEEKYNIAQEAWRTINCRNME